MKTTTIKRTLSLLLVVILMAAFTAPALAFSTMGVVPTEDRIKLNSYWHQAAYDGMNNGEACYVYQFPEGANVLIHPTYGGGWSTDLVDVDIVGHTTGFYFNFMYTIPYSIMHGDEVGDCVLEVMPDLYGDLDLSETSVITFGSRGFTGYYGYPMAGQTHITSVLLNGCYQLESVAFNGQEYCTQFDAVGCPVLDFVQLKDGAFRKIAFDLLECGETLYVNAFGVGSVGAEYSDGEARMFAYPEKDNFVGWYKDGVLVSNELECEVTEGGSYRAVYGGDADGDGMITVSDAITALRMSMGVADVEPSDMDVNGNGSVDIADAIMILKFAMGVL